MYLPFLSCHILRTWLCRLWMTTTLLLSYLMTHTNAFKEEEESYWKSIGLYKFMRKEKKRGRITLIILYHSNQFGRGCDLWHVCWNFGFRNLPNLPWHVQIFRKFSAVLRRRRPKISILGTWSLNEFSALQKLPWPPWHFSILEGLVICDCWIDLNGTVLCNAMRRWVLSLDLI